MKCHHFLCPLHKDYIPNTDCGLGIKAKSCASRKRYNRIIKQGKSMQYKNGNWFILCFNDERNKYYGRDKS